MTDMKKKVNIKSPVSLYVFSPPLSGVITGATLTYPEIYQCLGQGAYVEEILNDNSLVRLNFKNYNIDNNSVETVVEVLNEIIVDEEKEVIAEVLVEEEIPAEVLVEEEIIESLEQTESLIDVVADEPVKEIPVVKNGQVRQPYQKYTPKKNK